MAFRESRVWSEAVTSICRGDETPDDLCPFTQALRLFRRRSRFDVVVTMGVRPSLAYGLLCALLGRPSRQILTEIFLDEPRPHSRVWRIKTALFRWISRRAIGILTNSSGEVPLIAHRFAIPEGNLRFVPMYTTITQPRAPTINDGTVVSIGRTLRDLDTLVAASGRISAAVVIVAGHRDPLPTPLPPNVRVMRELPLPETHGLLARAAVAVVPLRTASRSAGQVFIFEAMAMGKPVVATRTVGTTDYIRHGDNGLLVEPGDAAALAEAVNRILHDPGLTNKLVAKALEDCQTQWLPDHHAMRKLKSIMELWNISREYSSGSRSCPKTPR